MKYLTKEWLIADRLACAGIRIKKSAKAETRNEEVYLRQYELNCKRYLSQEKALDFYRDPQADLKKIDKWIGESGLSVEERLKRIEYKKNFILIYEEWMETGVRFTFDEQKARLRFEAELRQKIRLYEHLPKEITDRIADIRLFALGYASAQVKALLKPCCEKLRRKSKTLKEWAFTETEEAEGYLSARLGVNYYDELFLMEIGQEDGDIRLEFYLGDKLLIRNGTITERETETLYPFCSDVPNSGWSMVLAAELHRIGEQFELCFLMENLNENNESEIWYFTVCGTDIEEVIAPENRKLYSVLGKSHISG